MEEEALRYSHKRIIPTVIILSFCCLLMGFLFGYILGFAQGEAKKNNTIKNPDNLLVIPPPAKKELWEEYIYPKPRPVPSGYIHM